MNWRSNYHVQRHAKNEQLRVMGKASVLSRELDRLASESPLYMPSSNKIAGYVIAGNCQHDGHFKKSELVLFDSGNSRQDSYQAILNGKNIMDNKGWHEWMELMAKQMQIKFIGNC